VHDVTRVLIANRGEIAVRVVRAAREVGLEAVAVHTPGDAAATHVRLADDAVALEEGGYLDAEALVAAAVRTGCALVHPGYGFLSESEELASRCAKAGLTFVGPDPEVLGLFGDKARARELAVSHGVPVLAATPAGIDLDGAHAFLAALGPGSAVMVKAAAGGGGRGMRVVRDADGIADALARASSEAERAFGAGEVYVEQLLESARHVEVQVLGDGTGAVTHFWDRECSIQRRHQKLLEMAPCVTLTREEREPLLAAAVELASAVGYRGLGTFEFLVDAGDPLESMKMEHVVVAPSSLRRRRDESMKMERWPPRRGRRRGRGRPTSPRCSSATPSASTTARPDAVERRRAPGSARRARTSTTSSTTAAFVEYGPLVIAAQRRRRELEDLIERTPADGLVGGIGTVDGRRCVVMSYDYTVLAGTQGLQNHRKKDRLFELAERQRLPVVFFAEGGGGRPGDTDGIGVSGLDCLAFNLFARLSGLVPLVGITPAAASPATPPSSAAATCHRHRGLEHRHGRPGDDRGRRPRRVRARGDRPDGRAGAQRRRRRRRGDEAEAVASPSVPLVLPGPTRLGGADQRAARRRPREPPAVYDVRAVVDALADTGSVLELRRGFGPGMVTALARVEGRPIGVVANNPTHLGGAIDADGADKAARFLQLCDAFDLPVLFLCDTPGIMVGPEASRPRWCAT
jgi:D-alanine-D-alanine ligase-like ATP-grasp enzyme